LATGSLPSTESARRSKTSFLLRFILPHLAYFIDARPMRNRLALIIIFCYE
jgi:hypothetical protein